MARTPWAIIKQCLPCWLIESAPYKQAFMLSLIILIPPLLISPFLLSPLLILLLLTSATVVGALSAWISVKASRMVLKHTIPLHLPISLSSCLKLFLKAVGIHIFRSFPVINNLPWAWFSFTKTLFEYKDSLEDGESPGSISTSVPSNDMTPEGRMLIGEIDSVSLGGKNLSVVGHEESREVLDTTLTYDATVEKKLASCGIRVISKAESLEKVRMLGMGEGGIGSTAIKGKSSGGRRNIVYFSRGIHENQSYIMDSSASGKGNGEKKSVTEIMECEEDCQNHSVLYISGNSSPAGGYSLMGDCHPRPFSDSGLRKLEKKPIGEADSPLDSMKSTKGADRSCHLGPKEIIGEAKCSRGCNSHSWCQKGVNLEEELGLLVEDIHSECLESWYPSLSTNEDFPLELKILLGLCVKRAAALGEATNISTLSLKLGSLFLCHLREFRKSRRKKRAAEVLVHEATKEEASKPKITESFENYAAKEETALDCDGSQQYTSERSDVTTLECRNVVTAVEEDDGKNSREDSPRASSTYSRDSQAPSSTRPNPSIEAPLGEEAYYRLRFGSSTRKKNVHGHYLVNLAMLIVKDFVCKVGKLPMDSEVKLYFREFGSSLAESSPGKILVSMISRKVFLPLVDTVSDPQWLNARVASLLIDHVGAKVSLGSPEEEEESISYFSTSTSSVVTVKSDSGQEFSVDHHSNTAINIEKCEEVCVKNEDSSSREERRKSLSLPLEVSSSSITNPIDGRISSVLGGIISTTAGPLLPDNVGISYKPIKRMWSSPSVEEGKELDGEPDHKKKVRPFGRHIVDGLPVYSSALSGRAMLATSHAGTTSDIGQQRVQSSPLSKSSHDGTYEKSSSSSSTTNPAKKKFLGLPLRLQQPAEVTPHSGLFRSKSSHDVQASNEGNWHVEEGSELHEGAYLSDDPVSPLDGNKEDRDCFSRKSARSRSFHGMNYSRQRETFRARFAQKQEYLKREVEGKGTAAGSSQDDDGIILKFKSKREKPHTLASSEDSLGEENDKVFDDDVVELGKGLRTRWVKYSTGKKNTEGSMEEDSSQADAASSSSFQGLVGKGDRINVGDQLKSLSDDYEISDASERDEKHHIMWDADQTANTNPVSSMEVGAGKGANEFLQSSPVAGVEDGSMKEIVKDISPVYEEVEDLPSTVAKLKAFLKERNGSQKSEESAPSSAEGGKKEFDSLSSLELFLDQEPTQLPKPQSSPLEERPFSWPSDGGIFLNVRIPYTEISKGTTSSQSSNPLSYNSPHVFYCIEYDAAYPEEGADAAIIGLSGEDVEGQISAGISSHLPGEEYRKGLKNLENSEAVLPSPGTVINHIVVKRQFQEFLDLHAQLESDPLWKEALKGLKGPTRWLNLPFGKASASTVAGRRTLLQAYLRGVCTTMPQLASRSKALRTFMAYLGTSKAVAPGEALPLSVERVLPITAEGEGPVPRIDKFFARTVSGMFNTLKTALPGFDSQESTQQSSGSHASASSTPLPSTLVPSQLDTSSAPAALGEVKTTFGHPGTIKGTMMQLPAFLQFGSSNVATYPDLVDWDMNYNERDSGGFNSSGSVEGIPVKTFSLEEDVQAFLQRLGNSPTTKEDAEFAFEALDPNNDVEDNKYFDDQSVPKGHGRQYMVDSADEDDEEELDAFLPLCKMAINILCEALRGTGSWVSQGTVVHASKVIIGSYVEEKLQGFLKDVTTKEMWCHYVHILRVVLFHPPPADLNQSGSKENRNRSISGRQLAVAIFTAFPTSFRQVIGNHELLEAAKFIADSLQNKVILRELVLQVLHICVTHVISSGNRCILEN